MYEFNSTEQAVKEVTLFDIQTGLIPMIENDLRRGVCDPNQIQPHIMPTRGEQECADRKVAALRYLYVDKMAHNLIHETEHYLEGVK